MSKKIQDYTPYVSLAKTDVLPHTVAALAHEVRGVLAHEAMNSEVIATNTVIVDPNATALAGKIYTTFAAAMVYVQTQSPAANNRWTIKYSGSGSVVDTITMQDYVDVEAVHTVQIAAPLTSACTSYSKAGVLKNFDIQLFDGGASTYFVCKDCIISGVATLVFPPFNPTLTAGYLMFLNCTLKGGDFSDASEMVIFHSKADQSSSFQTVDQLTYAYHSYFSKAVLNGGWYYNCEIEDIGGSLTLTDNAAWIYKFFNTSFQGAYTVSGNTDMSFWECSGDAFTIDMGLAPNNFITYNCTDFTVSGANASSWVNYGGCFQDATAGLSASDTQTAIENLAGDTLRSVNVAGAAQGDVLYFNGSNWVNLAPGVSGQFLQTQGAAANPIWAAAGGGSTTLQQAFDNGQTITIADGDNQTLAITNNDNTNDTTTLDLDQNNGGIVIDLDHTSGDALTTKSVTIDSGNNGLGAVSAVEIVAVSDGSTCDALVINSTGGGGLGTGIDITVSGSTTAGVQAVVSGGSVNTGLDITATGGSNTGIGADITSTANSASDVSIGLKVDSTNSGAGDALALQVVNGVIEIASEVPSTTTNRLYNNSGTLYFNGGALTGGGATTFAALTDTNISGAAQGDVLYWDGSNWVNLGPGTNGYFLKTQGAAANPVWAAVSGSSSYASTFNATTDWTDDGSTYSITFTHSLATYDHIVQVKEGTGPYTVAYPDIDDTDTNNTKITVSKTPDERFAGRIMIKAL